jgi:hypothetical protein
MVLGDFVEVDMTSSPILLMTLMGRVDLGVALLALGGGMARPLSWLRLMAVAVLMFRFSGPLIASVGRRDWWLLVHSYLLCCLCNGVG